jgi:hypothetical protein
MLAFSNLFEKHLNKSPPNEITKNFLNQYVTILKYYSKEYFKQQTQLSIFKTIFYKNIFILQSVKDEMMTVYSIIKKMYNGFSRLAYLWKFKRAPIQMREDMCMNELDEKHKHTFILLQNNFKYFFSIKDLIKIMKNGLMNSSYFFPYPTVAKNPYNNVSFNDSTLYNIYFIIKNSSFVMPSLIHQYFICSWDLDLFFKENEGLIRNELIQDYISSSHFETLYPEVKFMLTNDTYGKNLKIHKDFPKEQLVSIMKPYLHLYLHVTYNTQGTFKRNEYIHLFYRKMKLFYLYNRFFGRKIIKTKNTENYVFEYDKETHTSKFLLKKTKITEIEYNSKHVDFCKKFTQNEIEELYNNLPIQERHRILNDHVLFDNIHNDDFDGDGDGDGYDTERYNDEY